MYKSTSYQPMHWDKNMRHLFALCILRQIWEHASCTRQQLRSYARSHLRVDFPGTYRQSHLEGLSQHDLNDRVDVAIKYIQKYDAEALQLSYNGPGRVFTYASKKSPYEILPFAAFSDDPEKDYLYGIIEIYRKESRKIEGALSYAENFARAIKRERPEYAEIIFYELKRAQRPLEFCPWTLDREVWDRGLEPVLKEAKQRYEDEGSANMEDQCNAGIVLRGEYVEVQQREDGTAVAISCVETLRGRKATPVCASLDVAVNTLEKMLEEKKQNLQAQLDAIEDVKSDLQETSSRVRKMWEAGQ